MGSFRLAGLRDSKKLKVLIVGCGKIAGGFDETSSNHKQYPLSHAGAFVASKKFEIIGCVDKNEKALNSFSHRWGVLNKWTSLESAISSGLNFDVVSICTPNYCHFDDLKRSLALKPRLIFCEKPLALNMVDAEEIVNICAHQKIKLAVNYSRRWDGKINTLRTRMLSGEFGELRGVIGTYNKGIFNNGSHLIDLLLYLLGPLQVEYASKGRVDFDNADPTVSAVLLTKDGFLIQLVGTDSRDYSIFELDLIFSKMHISMKDGGRRWTMREPIESSIFRGYKELSAGKTSPGGYQKTLLNAINNLYLTIKKDSETASNGLTALDTLRVCEAIFRKSQNNE